MELISPVSSLADPAKSMTTISRHHPVAAQTPHLFPFKVQPAGAWNFVIVFSFQCSSHGDSPFHQRAA